MSTLFPRTIHQIWLGKKPFPVSAEKWRASYQRFLPDWEYRLWQDADLPGLAEKLLCPELVLNEDLGMGIRCDTLRYEILRLFGGIYLDHDMELFRPLDELLIEDCLHVALSFNSLEHVSTALLASPAGHPFWTEFLMKLRQSVPPHRPENPWDVLHLTGYAAMRRSLDQWLEGDHSAREILSPDGWVAGWLFERGDLVAWSREAVHPYHVHELKAADFRIANFPRTYSAHHWQGEWFAEDAEVKALALTSP